ncbi:hypothetical protein [Luteolibacter sp. LG18]|uniref:hypothetical protein n=1 Tax=Luteolibacter sp. LG18 TaxID=2819286 RepID=UPI002B320018|nr:hypothetical protein llg_19060 [Luteolibacter sp. LG18]
MTSIFETISRGSLVLDFAGVLGLGLLALAAIRLARREHSWGGNMMAFGAMALLIARVFVVVTPYVMTNERLANMGPFGFSVQIALPTILLSLGLAGVVWGLWGHSRWLHDER